MISSLLNQIISPVFAADVIGTINLPAGIPSKVAQTGDYITAIIRFIIIIGGLFTLWQFLSGGLKFITSNGDKGKIQEANQQIMMSLVGLVIMAASFVIIAIFSKILFGDFTAILIPKFSSVTP
jgi:large-conductance mechanosensitive channel